MKNNLRKIVIIFLSISLNMCFGCSKDPSHRDGSFEYPQHMFWLKNKKNIFFHLHTLIWGPLKAVFTVENYVPQPQIELVSMLIKIIISSLLCQNDTII